MIPHPRRPHVVPIPETPKTSFWVKLLDLLTLGIVSLLGKIVILVVLFTHVDRHSGYSDHDRNAGYFFGFPAIWLGVALSRAPLVTLAKILVVFWGGGSDDSSPASIGTFQNLFRALVLFGLAIGVFKAVVHWPGLEKPGLWALVLFGYLISRRVPIKKEFKEAVDTPGDQSDAA